MDHTGIRGARNGSDESTAPNASLAPATSGLWNAHATWIGRTVSPASRRRPTAVSTASVGPEITVCVGEFRFAVTTRPARPASVSTSSIRATDAVTAAMVPGSPSRTWSRIASAARGAGREQVPGVKAPAAASATSSP